MSGVRDQRRVILIAVSNDIACLIGIAFGPRSARGKCFTADNAAQASAEQGRLYRMNSRFVVSFHFPLLKFGC